MPDPIALTPPATPAVNMAAAPATATAAPADGAATSDFSSALAALTIPPATALPDPAPQDPVAALPAAPAMPAGTRLPLTGRTLPRDPGTAEDKASDKPKALEATSPDVATPADPTAAAPVIALLPLPSAGAPTALPVETPGKARSLPQAAVALPAAPPRDPVQSPARTATVTQAAPPPRLGLQLRAAFAEGGETPAHGQTASEGSPARSEGDALASPVPTPQAAPQLAALIGPDPTPAPTASPHAVPGGPDLSALVDRLVEARGAAQAGDAAAPVSATVNHAEFGRVAVHFAPDAGGLNVTLSSPDPAFAGAAQAALTVGSAPSGDGAQFFDGRGAGSGMTPGRHDAAGNPASSGWGGNNPGGNGNPAPQGEARFAPARSDRTAAMPTTENGTSGIFA